MSEFDNKASQWDQNQMHLDRTKAVAKELLDRITLKKTMKALDFGAGTGLLSFFLKDYFTGITLMDTSAEMLKMAEEKLISTDQEKIKTLFFDLEKSDYTGEPFGIIYSQMALHHIKDVNTILKKFYGMLLPGGYIAIADLYSEDGSFHDPGAGVHFGFDPDELTKQMNACGFTNIAINQCFVIRKKSGTGTVKDYPVFLLTASK